MMVDTSTTLPSLTLSGLVNLLLPIALLGSFHVQQTDSAMSKVAVVTGANKGIGFAIAKKLARAPGHVCILTSRDRARGEQAVEDLSQEGLKAIFKQLDIGDPSSVERFASEMEGEYGRCDILVNNAGIAFKASDPTPFKEQAEPTLKTNFFDTVAFTEKMLPLIKKSPAGRIVNVASMSGQLSILKSRELRETFTSLVLTKPELQLLMRKFVNDVKSGQHEAEGWPSTCYGMSKLGLIAYTVIAARVEAGSSVLVNSCCPGYCDTDMTSHRGHLSPEEGARTPFMLTQMKDLAKGGVTGGFFQREALSRW